MIRTRAWGKEEGWKVRSRGGKKSPLPTPPSLLALQGERFYLSMKFVLIYTTSTILPAEMRLFMGQKGLGEALRSA